jgi:hypothetical protein
MLKHKSRLLTRSRDKALETNNTQTNLDNLSFNEGMH